MVTRAARRALVLILSIGLLAATVGGAAAAITPFPQDFSFDERDASLSTHRCSTAASTTATPSSAM